MVLSTLNQSKPSNRPTMATHGVNAPLFSATGESAVVNPTVVTIKPRSTTKPPRGLAPEERDDRAVVSAAGQPPQKIARRADPAR